MRRPVTGASRFLIALATGFGPHVGSPAGPGWANANGVVCAPNGRQLAMRGLLERRANPGDRRAHTLWLTTRVRQVLMEVMDLSKAHELDIYAGPSDDD